MYKTVRQGDASLQYTIVPEIDQSYMNEISSVLVLSGSSPVKKKIHQSTILESSYSTAFEAKYLVLRLTGFFISSLISICLIIQAASCNNHCRLIAPITNKTLAVFNRLDNNHEIQLNIKASTSNDFEILRLLKENELRIDSTNNKMSTSGSTRNEHESHNFENTLDRNNGEKTLSPTQEIATTSYSASTESTSKETIEVTSIVFEKSSNDLSSVIGPSTDSDVDVVRKLKMLKMPRIFIKLRTDDNIPNTYMKFGIASNKKNQTSTNVPAQGLSLEGTIKPSSDEQLSINGSVTIWNRLPSTTFESAIRPIILIFLAMILLWLVVDIARSPPFRPPRSWYSIEKIDAENPN